MSPQIADRVKENTATTGTGTLSLAGASVGFRSFVAGIGTGKSCYYCIADGTSWEVGIGTVTAGAPDTLSRDTVLASSAAGAKVNWPAGTKDVFVTFPAARLSAPPVLRPFSAVPVTAGRVFANIHVGAGANSKHEEGLGVAASITGDAIWRLRFQLPPLLPSGTPKLRLVALAAATSGVAKVNPKWIAVSMGGNPSSPLPLPEGAQTFTWGAGQSDIYKEATVPLVAGPLQEGQILVMDLVFEVSGWTLNAVSTWQASIYWD